ncbi:hypothetical protein OOZ15_08060 [Galbibacter sp. EGI 63066]|uniref:hypothetical protein n=1 Tax=Galbibacter sp. EGI 63066 TaxID=2993559 RepID=UPI002248B363|nr:hypothetical protein [Galbibacter sp. EGI 63066]MCX2679886.1 hypothetical protein [Galbibacter sp. EGI 63066]
MGNFISQILKNFTMKKITTFILMMLCVINVTAQVTQKYHRVKKVYTNMSSRHEFCLNGTTSTLSRKVNISIEDKLPIGTTFYYDFGADSGLWAVTYSRDSRNDDWDYNISGSSITIQDICVNTEKYHRFYFLGETSSEAQNEYCNVASSRRDAKVDILTPEPLTPDRVYYVNTSLNSYPPGYYYLKSSYYADSADEDENLSGTGSISPVSFPDSDNDGVIDVCDSNDKYHVIKYRGRTQQEAEASKCNNDAENSVGVNIDIDQALTIGKIYYIDRGTGIGHRYYEVTNTSNNPNSSAETNIGTSNIGSSFFANCSSELADIEITNLRIIRNGSTEIFNSNTNSTPTLSYNNSYEFRYTLKNSGGEAVDINLSKFFSYNSSFDQFNDYFIDDDEISSISPGGQATLKTYVTPGNGYIGSASVTNNQGYYFIFSVVYENSDNSLSEYENRVGFIYSTNTASKPPLKPYQVQTFDFSGNRVLSEEVNSKEEEEQVIQSLPKGNYIIKANNKTYKISKD